MTKLQLTVELPDSLAHEAAEAGLLTPRALAQMLRDRVRRDAADKLLAGAERASAAGSQPWSMAELQAEIDSVRQTAAGPETTAAA